MPVPDAVTFQVLAKHARFATEERAVVPLEYQYDLPEVDVTNVCLGL
jgi:hypothetical protein